MHLHFKRIILEGSKVFSFIDKKEIAQKGGSELTKK